MNPQALRFSSTRPSLVLASRRALALPLVIFLLIFTPGCGEDGTPGPVDPNVLVYQVDGSWRCDAAQDCQDVYDLELQEDTLLLIELTEVTGSSVPRFAMYAPGADLGGENLLTASAVDRRCAGTDKDDSMELTVDDAGTYRLAVGRDFGAGDRGNGGYHLKISGSKTFVVAGRTVDDESSLASDADCITRSYRTSDGWDCPVSTSCQVVYEFEFSAGERIEIAVTNLTGESYSQLGLFAPEVDPDVDGENLLTGANLGYACGLEDQDQVVPFTIPAAGIYRVGVGRIGNASVTTSGTYDLTIRSSQLFTAGGIWNKGGSRYVDNACFGRSTSRFTLNADWNCAFSEDCQDVYDVFLPSAAPFQVLVSNVTGSSVVRMAIYPPNPPYEGYNLITGTAEDMLCLGQDQGPAWQGDLQSGHYKVAIGRDWGLSAGPSGGYTVSMAALATNPFVDISVVSQSAQDDPSEASGTTCPPGKEAIAPPRPRFDMIRGELR